MSASPFGVGAAFFIVECTSDDSVHSTKRMRILQVIDSLQLGGAEVLLRDLALRWQKSGLEVDIAVLRTTGSPLEQELSQAGIRVFPTGGGEIYSLSQVRALAKLLPGYDLIQVHLFPAQLWVAMAAKLARTKAPLVTTEHSTLNSRRQKRSFHAVDRWMFRQYRKVICISEATANVLREWVPETARNLQVIPNGVDAARFREATPACKKDVVGCDAPVVVNVGRFEPQKNHTCLLRAMMRVPDAHLVLIGEGPLRPEAEDLARKLGIAERVHFLGRRADVPQLLKMADLYVQPSRFEGFGLAALEAMAAGIPVVASTVPGLASVVAGAGVLVPAGNEKRLAAEINSILRSPERREQLCRAGGRRAQEFTIERTADLYASAYRAVLGYDAKLEKQSC
ncbi:MAG: glycosyltransferase [Acidobacteriia bacterium]|nr:glycosyltransferase [Terriglobia bacterium]